MRLIKSGYGIFAVPKALYDHIQGEDCRRLLRTWEPSLCKIFDIPGITIDLLLGSRCILSAEVMKVKTMRVVYAVTGASRKVLQLYGRIGLLQPTIMLFI